MIREVWPCLMNGESDNANQCDPCSFPAAGPTTTIKYIPLVYFFNPIVTLLRPTVTKLPLNYIINPNIFLLRTFMKCIPHLQWCWEASSVDKRRCSYRCWGVCYGGLWGGGQWHNYWGIASCCLEIQKSQGWESRVRGRHNGLDSHLALIQETTYT